MFEDDASTSAARRTQNRRGAAGHRHRLPAARRRRHAAGGALLRWNQLMLDEIDYGMLLVGRAMARVMYLNHAARLALDARHPLQCAARRRAAARASSGT